MSNQPRKIVAKTLTVDRSAGEVFDYFKDMKNLEAGGAIKSLRKAERGWWKGETPAGSMKIRHAAVSKEHGILDHVFVGGGLTWDVFVRVISNHRGATVSWTFVRPDGMTDSQFEEQLKAFDAEIASWSKDIEEKMPRGY